MILQFKGAIEKFEDYIMKHLSLRTRVGAIEELTVKFEDEDYKLEEIVQINRKPTMVVLDASVFPQMLPNILATLQNSQMNLNPQQDGTTIYVALPKVTKDYRQSLAKVAKQHFVQCKDTISDVRNQHIRELKKKTNVPKDLMFRAENYIGAMQKAYVQKAEQILKTKQKELLGES
ncbi:Ribosome-recycling factor, mitochondrial [Eufriesea mexicana]|uniref:Ribosome-recycling factor, mitochondrial n=2 Tax=Eufriesea mexicana TaxID=516756 RepID=A0A310SI21_9HYME|nr:Ribosome-recycling factor, mitochondrial [Eufriesea mexicana]